MSEFTTLLIDLWLVKRDNRIVTSYKTCFIDELVGYLEVVIIGYMMSAGESNVFKNVNRRCVNS